MESNQRQHAETLTDAIERQMKIFFYWMTFVMNS